MSSRSRRRAAESARFCEFRTSPNLCATATDNLSHDLAPDARTGAKASLDPGVGANLLLASSKAARHAGCPGGVAFPPIRAQTRGAYANRGMPFAARKRVYRLSPATGIGQVLLHLWPTAAIAETCVGRR
jgi:hypothetical protein